MESKSKTKILWSRDLNTNESIPRLKSFKHAKSDGDILRLHSSKLSRRNSLSASILHTTLEDSVFFCLRSEDVMKEAKGLCRDFICYRLKRSGYRGRVVITQHPPASDQELSIELLTICYSIEAKHPYLYKNLARQLGYTIKSEDVLRVIFIKLSDQVMGEVSPMFTWSRVASLFCISGALAVDCMTQGHCELIETMVSIFGEYVEAHLVKWITDNGGWTAMVDHFIPPKPAEDDKVETKRTITKLLFIVASATLVIAYSLTFFNRRLKIQ